MKKVIFIIFASCTTLIFTFDKAYLKQFLPENPVIIEAGARWGEDTVQMIKVWPQATVYAFEPVPRLFNTLKKNTTNHENVFAYEYALSDKTGTAIMHVSKGCGDGSSSLLAPKEHLNYWPGVSFPQKITVQTTTIDEWAEKNNIDHVDFMWLDMQGYEMFALQAAPQILKTVRVIYTEVNTAETYKGVPLYRDYRSWLEQEGFVVVKEHFWKCQGNVLFVRKEFIP